MKHYCVVYKVYGIHYIYRCIAENVTEAKKFCKENMGCLNKEIVEVYEEQKGELI